MSKAVDTETVVLCSIRDGRVDLPALLTLAPWRAVLLADVAYKASAMRRGERDELARLVRVTGEVPGLHRVAGR